VDLPLSLAALQAIRGGLTLAGALALYQQGADDAADDTDDAAADAVADDGCGTNHRAHDSKHGDQTDEADEDGGLSAVWLRAALVPRYRHHPAAGPLHSGAQHTSRVSALALWAPQLRQLQDIDPDLAASVGSLVALLDRRDVAIASLQAAVAGGTAGSAARAAGAVARAEAATAELLALSEEVDGALLDFTLPGTAGTPLVLLPRQIAVATVDASASLATAAGSTLASAFTHSAAVGEALSLAEECVRCAGVSIYAAAEYTHLLLGGGAVTLPSGVHLPSAVPLPSVSLPSLHVYVEGLLRTLLAEGIAPQAHAFTRGFAHYAPAGASVLRLLTVTETRSLFDGSDAVADDRLWTPAALAQAIGPGSGYTERSPQMGFLLQAVSSLTPPQRRAFLQFLTGSSRLPLGGFAALQPRISVIRVAVDDAGSGAGSGSGLRGLSSGSIGGSGSGRGLFGRPAVTADDLLPTASTCQHYIKLPPYSSAEVARAKLLLAIREGQGAFAFN
jgi:hypothetical protein